MWRSTLIGTAAAALTVLALPAHAICGLAQPMVETSTSANADGSSWHYNVFAQGQLSTCNQVAAQSLADFYLPYFTDMGVVNVGTAAGWVFSLEPTNDLFGLGGGVMHFSTASRPSELTFVNFSTTASFDALYDGTKGPYMTRLYTVDTGVYGNVFGDPLIPASPLTVAALQAAVPEPGSAWLLGLGLGLMGVAAGTRRKA